jgi:signal transduction histidine kinase
MKFPTLEQIKRATLGSTLGQEAKPTGGSGLRLTWPLALACGFLIFVTGSSVYLVFASRSTGELVNQALRVETRVYIMLNAVRMAESGQRGYLLTGNPEYLDIYRVATQAFEPAIADLKAAIIDPAQQRAVSEMEPVVERKFAELAETIRLYQAGNGSDALALVQRGTGRDFMTDISTRSSNILQAEQRIINIRSSNSSSKEEWLLVVNFVGLLLVIALSLISFLFMRRSAEHERIYVSELERSNQELDDFAYIASHDLKEPLRGLFNHASFLLEDYEDKIDADGVRRLNRLGQLCQRMERLINDLLYFSRLGRGELAVQETDPNAVITEIQHMMETLLSERNAHIVLPRALPRVVCDKTRLTEVLRNLITNAVKYNDKDRRLVEIGFLEAVLTGDRTEKNVFYVRDNGVGIEPEFHREIFRIFKRLQGASDGEETGTGVGLTFVKKIVERHGGKVWLDSELGKGTVFYFTLNCARIGTARNAHDTAIEPIPVHSAG